MAIKAVKTATFNGKIYEKCGKNGYYFLHTTRNCERRNAKQLHRAVWEYYNGKIPYGFQIHHIDGNKDNNDISNLECLSIHDHLSMHSKAEMEKNTMHRELFQKNGIEAARKWHKSPEGIEWHKEHAKCMSKTYGKTFHHVCKECGKDFFGGLQAEFCCNPCMQKFKYWQKRGKRPLPKCKWCGKEFMPYSGGNNRKWFCCESCVHEYKLQQHRDWLKQNSSLQHDG